MKENCTEQLTSWILYFIVYFTSCCQHTDISRNVSIQNHAKIVKLF